MYDHQFPPTIWQCVSWNLEGARVAWLVLAIVVAVCVMRMRVSTLGYLLWPICLAVFSVELLQKHRLSSDPYRQIDPVNYCLNAAIVLTALVSMVRTWWSSTGTRYGFESIVLAFVVFVLSDYLFYGYNCPPGTRTMCKNNLKQIGLALHNYHDVESTFPPATFGTPTASWRIALLPFLEEAELYSQYDQSQEWDSVSNQPLGRVRISAYDCAQRPVGRERNEAGQFLTSYVAPVGPSTVMGGKGGSVIRGITDGTSNTLMIVEACGSEIVWSGPRDITVAPESISVNAAAAEIDHSNSLLSSYHQGGAQALLCDGSARFIGENIDAAVLSALLTKDGGEVPRQDW